jgi:hypothetical protein
MKNQYKMSTLKKPKKVKLIIAFFSNSINLLDKTEKILIIKFGKADYKSQDIEFNETDYYSSEMGENIKLRFIAFNKLINRNKLPEIKIKTCRIEKKFSFLNKRTVNIDPGLMSLENFILATGKSFTHRIYLKKGVWADLTLIFHKGDFTELPWTFPNYRTERIKKILKEIRTIYYKQIKSIL